MAACAGPAPAAPDRPPNFVLLFADDLGYGDLGCYGSPDIRTPNLDRLAAEGVRFTNFYSCAPVCTPSRAALLTGRYPVRSGLTRVLFPASRDGLDDSEITLAEALRARGYATACVGKWHLGHLPPYLPTRHGFDRYFGIPYSNDMDIPKRGEPPIPLLRDEVIVEQPADLATLTRRYTEEAVRFIQANRDRPFFLYVPYTMPHVPLAASDAFRGRSKRGLYGDVVEELDGSVGGIARALRDAGLEERTLVVFTSDNGPWLTQGAHGGSAGPLRNGKGTTFEGGIREPCIARRPGMIAPGRVEDRPAMMADWFPTFVRLAGGTPPADRAIDGRDLAGLLSGSGARADEEFFFFRSETLQAHRSGPWKLKRPVRNQPPQPSDHPLLLFNLVDDPGETANLADRHPEVVARLQRRMEEFEGSLGTLPAPKK